MSEYIENIKRNISETRTMKFGGEPKESGAYKVLIRRPMPDKNSPRDIRNMFFSLTNPSGKEFEVTTAKFSYANGWERPYIIAYEKLEEEQANERERKTETP